MTNRRKMRTRELGIPLFFFVMYRVFERKEIGIFKGKDSVHFFVADEVRQFHLMIEMERHGKK